MYLIIWKEHVTDNFKLLSCDSCGEMRKSSKVTSKPTPALYLNKLTAQFL